MSIKSWSVSYRYLAMRAMCCEQVLFPTRLDQYSNKKRHRTKSLWYICSKEHKGKRSEQFLWDNMHIKQQGKDFMIIPWCNEQQNAQLPQNELTYKTRLCKLKEADQRASRVKAREVKVARDTRMTGTEPSS